MKRILAVIVILSGGSGYGMNEVRVSAAYPPQDASRDPILEALGVLQEHNITFQAKALHGEMLLAAAIKARCLRAVKLLLSVPSVDRDQTNLYGETPLYCAVRGGDTEIVQLLLDAHADGNNQFWNMKLLCFALQVQDKKFW